MRLGIFARTFSRPTVEEVFDAVREKVVIDPANLIVPGDKHQMRQVLDEAFDLLAEHIIIAHAKDRGADDTFQAAGGGILDYDQYVSLLRAAAFDGPLILHGLPEGQVDAALQFLRGKFQRS